MTRSKSREHLFCLIFQKEFYTKAEMEQQKELYFEQMLAESPKEYDYLSKRFSALLNVLDEIDTYIEQNAKGWKIDRIGKAELTILRLAIYEIKYDDEIPSLVAINEAVELAKKYGADNAPSFVNGILGSVANEQ